MRVAVVFDTPYPDWTSADYWNRMEHELGPDYDGEPEVEYQVANALRSRGHQVVLIGACSRPDEVTDPLAESRPDMVFNLAEGFRAKDHLDFVLPAALEMHGHPYTGAGPQALMITRDKAMTKKILAHHGLSVPRFFVARIGEHVPRAKSELFFPAIVKPLALDSSTGISQASVVNDRDQLVARVAYVHEQLGDAAIVEEYIDGRELYVSVLGNGRQARALPALELEFSDQLTRPEQRIVTRTVKWDDDYCKARGIRLRFARRMSAAAGETLTRTVLTAYRALWLRDYARFDLRLGTDDRVYVLEANANPYLSEGHEAAEAARKSGLGYPELIERIVQIARRRHRRERKRQRR